MRSSIVRWSALAQGNLEIFVQLLEAGSGVKTIFGARLLESRYERRLSVRAYGAFERHFSMERSDPYNTPEELQSSSTRGVPLSRNPLVWFCVLYYALAIAWGIHSAVAAEPSAGDFVLSVLLALCLGVWATVDASRRQQPIPRSRQFWYLALAWIVVPGYVIGSRGWKGVGWVALHAATWILIADNVLNIAQI